jgi:hypothetical protein
MLSLDSTRWVRSSEATFICTECHTLKHVSELLVCDCDKESQFVIAGKQHGEPVYWNNDQGWIDDLTEATTFSTGIFGEPLPPGAESLLELTLTGDHVACYSCTPPPGGGL